MKFIKYIIPIFVVGAGAAFFIFQQGPTKSETVDITDGMSPLEKTLYYYKLEVDKFKEPLYVTKLFVKKKDVEANKVFVKNLFNPENESLNDFVPIMPKEFWACLIKNQDKDSAEGKLLFRILRADEEKMALEMYNVWLDEKSFKANAEACNNDKLKEGFLANGFELDEVQTGNMKADIKSHIDSLKSSRHLVRFSPSSVEKN